MHERSLVKTLIDQVREEARVRNMGRIHEIQLQIGEFSGVEPLLMESAFCEMSAEYWEYEVRLIVEVISLKASCRTCGECFSIENFHFFCPTCDGKDVEVTAGEEMRLVNILAERQSTCEGVVP